MKFTIPGELPSMNEIIKAAKSHYAVYSKMKQENTELCGYAALKQKAISRPVKVIIQWYTKDLKKDPDNVSAGQKFILDGIVEAGIIPNDTRKYIKEITHMFPDPDKENPRVEVELKEVG
jgi:hypothetical protein